MRLRRGLGYPTQITVPYVFTVCNLTLQKKFFTHAQKLPKPFLAFLVLAESALPCSIHSSIHPKRMDFVSRKSQVMASNTACNLSKLRYGLNGLITVQL